MVEKLPLVNPFGNPFGVLAHTVKAEDLVRFQKGGYSRILAMISAFVPDFANQRLAANRFH